MVLSRQPNWQLEYKKLADRVVHTSQASRTHSEECTVDWHRLNRRHPPQSAVASILRSKKGIDNRLLLYLTRIETKPQRWTWEGFIFLLKNKTHIQAFAKEHGLRVY